ncbi:hypothetical protein RJT34_17047 [Clitoria ternatea]|uniref:Exocyst subunit Exo70 family protein n=1 Tax=Clitoria ternatea TaxID=43366 RepID=A0AAN9JAD6_CLITE
MISSGYMCQCIEAYATVRKSIVDAAFQRMRIDDAQWDQLEPEPKIRRWAEASNFCFRTLFPNEKKLCQLIFDGVESFIAEACFMETVKAPAIQLLEFTEATSITLTSSPHNLFDILYMYRSLEYLMSENRLMFVSESIHVTAAEVLPRLAEAARGTFSLFENEVFGDTSKVAVPDGAIHPLTTYVMDYLSLISYIYKQTLNKVIVSNPSSSSPDMDFSDFEGVEEGKTQLEMHIIWILQILRFKLDVKSKQYKDESLSHLFLMNNIHYIFKRGRGSYKLREMVGDYYLKKLTVKTHKAATRYFWATWGRVLHCLREEGLCAKNGGALNKSVFRKRIKDFNAMFDKVTRTQAVWSVPDSQLRKDLRKSILQKLIPAYQSFIERGSEMVKSVKYSVGDLRTTVWDCFKGIPSS